MFQRSGSECNFPDELQGPWLSSRFGEVNFTTSNLTGYPSNFGTCNVCPDEWTCVVNSDDRYLLRSIEQYVTLLGSRLYLYTCFYLYRLTSTKYLYYQAPEDQIGTITSLDYVFWSLEDSFTDIDYVCDLATPLPPQRHHLLIKKDATEGASSTCATDLLGSYENTDTASCNTTIDTCVNQNEVIVSNTECSPKVFFSSNGSLECLYSLAAFDAVYITLYNKDDFVDDVESFRFTCIVLSTSGEVKLLSQQPSHCIDLPTPTENTKDYMLNLSALCPIACTFLTTLQGNWTTSRKGSLEITESAIIGFEPFGETCTSSNCLNSTLPQDFDCYYNDGVKYLIRSETTTINSESVRIYVCLDFQDITTSRIIYYQAHSEKNNELDEYVSVLNSASPIDSIFEVCESELDYHPTRSNIMLSAGSETSYGSECPENLNFIYESEQSNNCTYTLRSCETRTQIEISKPSCDLTPLYTEDGTVNCLYFSVFENTTYLTVYNIDQNINDNIESRFVCVAYSTSAESLTFTQTMGGCEEAQTSVNSTEGIIYSFTDRDSCNNDVDTDSATASDEFPWYIILGIILGALFFISVLVVIIVCCCCPRLCFCFIRKEKNLIDEKNTLENEKGEPYLYQDNTSSLSNEDDQLAYLNEVDGNTKTRINNVLFAQARKSRKSRLAPNGQGGDFGFDGMEDSTSGRTDDDLYSDEEWDSDVSNNSKERMEKLFGSRFNIHVARAWSERRGSTRSNKRGDSREKKNRKDGRKVHFPFSKLLSLKKVLQRKAGKQRSHYKKSENMSSKSSGISSGSLFRHHRCKISPMSSLNRESRKLPSVFASDKSAPFLLQYNNYVEQRDKLSVEGYFELANGQLINNLMVKSAISSKSRKTSDQDSVIVDDMETSSISQTSFINDSFQEDVDVTEEISDNPPIQAPDGVLDNSTMYSCSTNVTRSSIKRQDSVIFLPVLPQEETVEYYKRHPSTSRRGKVSRLFRPSYPEEKKSGSTPRRSANGRKRNAHLQRIKGKNGEYDALRWVVRNNQGQDPIKKEESFPKVNNHSLEHFANLVSRGEIKSTEEAYIKNLVGQIFQDKKCIDQAIASSSVVHSER